MSIIATEQLSKRYGRRVGLEFVNLRVGEGEIFGFLGANGAGKTTAIRLLLGFLRPTHGNARIGGLDCWRQSAQIKRDVGYLPGDLRLYPWLTGQTALSIVSRIRRVDLRASGSAWAERWGLEMDLSVRRMSRGTRQKLGLLLALVHQPQLLILDEPTAGLDPVMQSVLADCLREHASAGGTVFFSSHTLREVETLCDRVAVVRHGRVIADETLAELRTKARRTVELVFTDAETAARIALPDFLKLVRREGRKCHCELSGSAGPLIHWAAQQPVKDINISPPNLESLFRTFYDASLD